MTHWAAAYIGLPFDPVEHHCWAFARRVWLERFGWDVAELDVTALDPRQVRRDFAGHPEFGQWHPVAAPMEGDAVVMARGTRPCHVGVWVAPDRILHAVEGIGVISTPAVRLGDLHYRAHGFYRRTA